jgi:hypothetical protein
MYLEDGGRKVGNRLSEYEESFHEDGNRKTFSVFCLSLQAKQLPFLPNPYIIIIIIFFSSFSSSSNGTTSLGGT